MRSALWRTLASTLPIARASPTSSVWMCGVSSESWAAPRTISPGAWSPPIASSATVTDGASSVIGADKISHSQRVAQGGAGQEARGVEGRQRRIVVLHQERNFGAAEDDGVAAVFFHLLDDALKALHRLGREDSVHQLVHDDVMDLLA